MKNANARFRGLGSIAWASLTPQGAVIHVIVDTLTDLTEMLRQVGEIDHTEDLPRMVAEHEVHAPTLVIVGEVVQLREKLAWFEGAQ